MNILVTGGAGFIGSNFILYWLEAHPQDYIINLDKLTYAGNINNLQSVSNLSHYRFIQGDIVDKRVVKAAIDGTDVVVHFAAESHVDRSITGPSVFVETNVLGTHTLLEQALKSRVKRFHHISTDEVFGTLSLKDTQKFTESSPYNPRSPYAASKAASDHLVRAYYYTYGLPITISNCSNNYGPYQYPEKLIPFVITNAIDNKPIPIYGDGLYVRDWLYVRDHCRAIDLILKEGKIGQTYCVGGLNQDISNKEIAQKILKLMRKDEQLLYHSKDRPGHDRRYAIDWSKIRNELGFSPEHDFNTWLVNTVRWYQANEEWWRNAKDRNTM